MLLMSGRVSHVHSNPQLGKWDPVTREPVTPFQLVPNAALRAAVLAYLEEHPWAWAECF